MHYNLIMDKKAFVNYLRVLGIEVHTTTKARGNHGFYLNNRIDISKNVPDNRFVPTLLHEFAHYIHAKIEPDMPKTGGSLKVLFGLDTPVLEKELFKVTNFVDENSLCIRLIEHRERVHEKIIEFDRIIKKDYPAFLRSKKFKEFEKYIKRSDARYLLKYDRVKVMGGFLGLRTKVFTIDTIEKDFPDMPRAFAAYIRLKSAVRKQTRISKKINKFKKYYTKPTELFARFIEGLYLDREWVEAIAPTACEQFFTRLENGYYLELADLIKS